MKKLIFALVTTVAFSQSALASNCSLVAENCDEEEPQTRMCTAKDAHGTAFNYYTSNVHPVSYTKRKAVEKCQGESAAPASCKLVGCHEY